MQTLVALVFWAVQQASWAEEVLDQQSDSIGAESLNEALTELGWRRLGLDDVPETEFTLTPNGIRVEANSSNALIYRELNEEESLSETLRWTWRVDQLPSSKTLRKVNADDRALALYVGFEIDQRNLSFWGRIRSSIVARFSGLPKGKVLTYAWGKDDATGEWFPNPYIRHTGRMTVLRNATTPSGEWQQEEIDLVADFTAAFGYPPIRPVYLALSADTEDSGDRSLGWFRNIEFVRSEN